MQSNTPSRYSWIISLKKMAWVFKWGLLVAMLGYLYMTIQQKGQSLEDVYWQLRQNLNREHWVELVIVGLLTPVNWACESRKWQLLAQKVEKINFFESLKGVLAGLALGFLLPNNVGDAAGRVLSLQSHQRLSGVGAALLANGLQFYVSLTFGTLGIGYLIVCLPAFQNSAAWVLLGALVSTIVAGIWLIVKRKEATFYLEKFRWFRWIAPYVEIISQYSISEIVAAWRWAVIRYGVFTLQFFLLLQVFKVTLPLGAAISNIFLVFFAKTLIPALNFLGDLGIREASSLYFFSFYEVAPSQIVAVTLTLWFVNILLPVLLGVVWVMKLKWWGNDFKP